MQTRYVEKHHIIPRSMGGSNAAENICTLSAKEHFICHLLLTRMTEGKWKAKCVYALSMMMRFSKHHERYTTMNSKTVSYLREEMAKCTAATHKGKVVSEEQKQKQSRAMKGRQLSNETKEKIGLAQLGKKRSEETVAKIKAANTGKKRSLEHLEWRKNNPSAQLSGAKNGMAKSITLKSPDGTLYYSIGAFKKLCDEHELSYATMNRILQKKIYPSSGRCFGWDCWFT